MGDSQKFRDADPEFLATAKLRGISFVRYPLSKKGMASTTDAALIRHRDPFERYQHLRK